MLWMLDCYFVFLTGLWKDSLWEAKECSDLLCPSYTKVSLSFTTAFKADWVWLDLLLFFFLHSEIIFSLRLLRNNPFVSDSYLETYTHPYIYSSKYLDALESSSKGISGGCSIKSSTRLLLCRRNNAFHPERGNPADEQSTPRGHCDPGILVSIHNTEWSSGPDRAEGVRVFSLGWVLGKSADVSWPFPPLFSLFPLLSLALSFEAYQ